MTLVKMVLKGAWRIVAFAFRAIEAMWHVVFDVLGLLGRGGLVLYDFGKARHRLSAGTLVCPRGHANPTEGGVYSCSSCGFVYAGSIWLCGNPECQAKTPFVHCVECGLSVRNPYRWGRP